MPCSYSYYYFPVFTIWVKRPPKPHPVKRRPPSARRFYLMEPAMPSGLYIRHRLPSTSAIPLYLSFSAALTAPPGCPPVLSRSRRTLRLGLTPMMSSIIGWGLWARHSTSSPPSSLFSTLSTPMRVVEPSFRPRTSTSPMRKSRSGGECGWHDCVTLAVGACLAESTTEPIRKLPREINENEKSAPPSLRWARHS